MPWLTFGEYQDCQRVVVLLPYSAIAQYHHRHEAASNDRVPSRRNVNVDLNLNIKRRRPASSRFARLLQDCAAPSESLSVKSPATAWR